ncbi:hypothetical protein [Ornithinimicrobium sp. W1665]
MKEWGEGKKGERGEGRIGEFIKGNGRRSKRKMGKWKEWRDGECIWGSIIVMELGDIVFEGGWGRREIENGGERRGIGGKD